MAFFKISTSEPVALLSYSQGFGAESDAILAPLTMLSPGK